MYEHLPDFTAPAGWSLDQTAQSRVQPHHTSLWRLGVTGRQVIRPGSRLEATDILRLLAPGLAALGADVRFEEMPPRTARLGFLLRRLAQRGASAALLRFEPGQATSGGQHCDDPELVNDRRLAGCGFLAAEFQVFGNCEGGWRCVSAPGDAPHAATTARLRRSFTHIAWFVASRTRGRRRAVVRSALLRWLAFLAACPERSWLDHSAGPFLLTAAGSRRDPAARLLRNAAQLLSESSAPGETTAGIALLRKAVLLDLQLSPLAQNALLQPEDEPLSPLQRREMIYLARAATPDIRVICARRLAKEWRHDEVRATLRTVQETGDRWMRAAARTEE